VVNLYAELGEWDMLTFIGVASSLFWLVGFVCFGMGGFVEALALGSKSESCSSSVSVSDYIK
jgi:hypothetical protein